MRIRHLSGTYTVFSGLAPQPESGLSIAGDSELCTPTWDSISDPDLEPIPLLSYLDINNPFRGVNPRRGLTKLLQVLIT